MIVDLIKNYLVKALVGLSANLHDRGAYPIQELLKYLKSKNKKYKRQ
jgi:hypothetical protein